MRKKIDEILKENGYLYKKYQVTNAILSLFKETVKEAKPKFNQENRTGMESFKEIAVDKFEANLLAKIE